jgi:hypothetical protein
VCQFRLAERIENNWVERDQSNAQLVISRDFFSFQLGKMLIWQLAASVVEITSLRKLTRRGGVLAHRSKCTYYENSF